MAHLGIDAGGTSTRAVVVTEAGECIGLGRSGSGNPISSGPTVAAASVRAATAEALAAADLPGSAVGTTAIAMAGGSAEDRVEASGTGVRSALLPLGVARTPTIEKDLLALYCSGSFEPDGYAMVSGTGAAAVRVADGDVVAICDGLGWLLGDDGSGFWVGREVVRAVAAALDGRGPRTALTGLLLSGLSLPEPGTTWARDHDGALPGLVAHVYDLPPVALARFAPLAFEAARADGRDGSDEVAAEIVDRAGHLLARTLSAVVTPEVPGPVVLGGSVLAHQPAVRDVLSAHLLEVGHPGALVVVPDGLAGAAVIALRRAGVVVDASVFARITTSLARFR
ncbi:MAG: BadF/BadG/BcrA/BcrD ATPase family protein [Terracoccus sp.]